MMGEVRALNSLRGLAACIVLVSHYANETAFHPALGNGGGQIGVMLFFLLSGFLMAHLYLSRPPDRAALRTFAVARAARVVPLFLVVVVASFLLTRFAPAPFGYLLYRIADVPMLISHVLFVHGENVLWTIPPEMQFYVLFGLAWTLLPRFGGGLAVLVGVTLIADFFAGFQETTHVVCGVTLTTTLFRVFPYFAIGALLGWGYRRWKIPETLRSHLFVGALLLIPALYPKIFFWFTGANHAMWSDVGVLAVMSSVFFAVVFLVPPGNLLLESRIGDYVGKISYSIYLLHVPVLHVMMGAGWSGGAVGLLVFFTITCLAASLSYLLIEAPLRAWIRRRFAGMESSLSF